jgi:hypothetical protein
VQLAQRQSEAPRGRQHHLGQQRRAVAGEQAVQRAPDAAQEVIDQGQRPQPLGEHAQLGG